jgi:short-subunit dehydrogenase
MRVHGAVVLVTGASSGIGRAAALRLAAAGARLLVHGTDADRVTELAEQVGGVPFVADLAKPGAAEWLAEATLAAAGRVDIVVNNAGIGWAGPVTEMPAADVTRLVAVNLTAPIALTRALLPQLVERGAGYVMFVASIAGRLGVAGESVYSATKGGLDVFAESLRLELAGTGVRVGVLVPGVVQTAFFERRGRPYERSRPRPLPVTAAGDALVRMIETDRSERYLPGWLRVPVAVRGALPYVYRRLGGRFGGSG